MTELEKARMTINEVDEKMAKLFVKRMTTIEIVAKYKRENGLRIENLNRESEIIEKNSTRVPETYRAYYTRFLKNNMDLSKQFQYRLMNGMSVAYSGTKGAFAEIVSSKIFPYATLVSYSDFESAYRAVENGDCEYVVLPMENSFNGDVGQVMDLAFFGSLFINNIYEVKIVQNLLGIKGTDISKIKKVISHPQALGQSANYIKEHGFEVIEAVNTAVAAKMVSESGRDDIAAIASEEAAERFGLVKIEGHINESSTNTTRFAVFSPVRKEPESTDERFIILFTVRNVAGSLGKAVSVIGKYGFNLRVIKSRPTKNLIWDYYFYAEGEGNISSDRGQKMIEELKQICNNLRIIGSFEKDISV